MAGTTAETIKAGQTGQFTGAPAEALTRAAGKGSAFAEGYGEARTELPAFLEKDEFGEYKLPEGYEMVALQFGDTKSFRLDAAPESRMVFYLDDIGIRLTRGVGDEAYLLFEGLPLPDGVYVRDSDSGQARLLTVPANGIPLGGWLGEGSERIPVEIVRIIEGKSNRRNVGAYIVEEVEGTLIIEFPFREIQYANEQVRTPNLGDLGVVFSLEDGNIKIQNRDPKSYGWIIVAPAAAIVRPASAESYGEARPAAVAASLGEAKEEQVGAGAGVEQVAAEWKEGLKGKGNELAKSLEDYIKEASLGNLVNLLKSFTNLGVGVYLERPEAVGEEEFGQQAGGFDEAAEVMLGYFRQILGGSESLVFNPLLKTYDDTVGWSNHLKLYFDQAVAFDQLISESAKEKQRDYAILGAAALTRVGQLVLSRIPEGAKVDIGELRKLYQEAVEQYLARLSLL